MTMINTEVLVIGTGPSGGAAALALARSGVPVIVVNRYGWTCRTPRAHITNPRTMEVLRDLGVMDDVLHYSVPNDMIGETVLCHSLAGNEYGRVRTFGIHPDRRALYAAASPETTVDLPQNFLEKILIGAAAHQGAQVHFHTEFTRFEQDADGVTSYLFNRLTGHEFTIRSKYLIGADGGNSLVAKLAGLPFLGERAKGGGAANIVFDADLTHLTAYRPSVLYWIVRDHDGQGYIAPLRMIRPWKRWLVIVPWDLTANGADMTEAWAIRTVHDLIGDDSIPLNIDSLSLWTINEQWATRLREGRVFCMGDAVHRHPPTKGLGSNTCIQDAYNLGWKIAHVMKGWAAPGLLDSYDVERAPVAEQIVKAAFGSRDYFIPTFTALAEAARRTGGPGNASDILNDNSDTSENLRTMMRESIVNSHRLYDSPALEIDQRYVSAAALPEPGEVMPPPVKDTELEYKSTTFPGARLPHGWVFRNGRRTSLLYLCGDGSFTLLTGNSGLPWRNAAAGLTEMLGVPINVRIIGPGQDYEDLYGDYSRLSEVEESGAVLVRPDMHVAWRSKRWNCSAADDLLQAMTSILGWTSVEQARAAIPVGGRLARLIHQKCPEGLAGVA